MKRIAETCTFLEYATQWCLVPQSGASVLADASSIGADHSNSRWFDIPSYQRGLVWNEDHIENLLCQNSEFLGNVIFCEIAGERQGKYKHLPSNTDKYSIVIDGLQRFSIGTALLNVLHPVYLSDNSVDSASSLGLVQKIKERTGLKSIYIHNNRELIIHNRISIKESYVKFLKKLEKWVDKQRKENEKEFIEQIVSLLNRQITTDVYIGFKSPYALTNTFIGLNVNRVQLNDTDWLRAIIIDQGGACGWPHQDLESIDNLFTKTFTVDGSKENKELSPFVKILKTALTTSNTSKENPCQFVFKSWSLFPSPTLDIEDVKKFLRFVSDIKNYTDNHYFNEIRACGALPFCSLIVYYYRNKIGKSVWPGFENGEHLDSNELAVFLRGCYRVLIDGSIGKTNKIMMDLFKNSDNDLINAAQALSHTYLEIKMDEPVDMAWLTSKLQQIEHNNAQRVFNLCRLPELNDDSGFTPDDYNRNKDGYIIKQLIPVKPSAIKNQPGELQIKKLPNLIPLPPNLLIENVDCSDKLTELSKSMPEEKAHPYLKWLVDNQAKYQAQLDEPKFLEPNISPNIGVERIKWLASHIVKRL